MSNVVTLDEYRPHLLMESEMGTHVIPSSVFADIEQGRLPLDSLPECVLRAAVGGYARLLQDPDGSV